MSKKASKPQAPVVKEKVALLCTHETCSGYRILVLSTADIEAGERAGNHAFNCPLSTGYGHGHGALLRAPDAPESQVVLLKRDIAGLERANAQLREDARLDRVRLETIDRVLDKLGRASNMPFMVGLPRGGFGSY